MTFKNINNLVLRNSLQAKVDLELRLIFLPQPPKLGL